jgi:hypothetical protein
MFLRVLIVVPAYNEGESLGELLREIKTCVPGGEVVVVNDGSRDNTGPVAQKNRATLLDLPINLGIGGAVQSGFQYGWRRGCEVCIQVDGDGQHNPADIPALLEPLQNGQADCVVGSRFFGKQGGYQSTFSRRLGIGLLSRLLWLLSGKRILDVTSGFRAMNRRAFGLLAVSYPDDYPETESLLSLLLAGCRVVEVPVTMRDRQGGRSSIFGFRTLVYMVKVSLALIIAKLRWQLNPAGKVESEP